MNDDVRHNFPTWAMYFLCNVATFISPKKPMNRLKSHYLQLPKCKKQVTCCPLLYTMLCLNKHFSEFTIHMESF